MSDSSGSSKSLSKQEFGRKLNALMLERGWNQSELARFAGMRRAAISTYLRGRSMPGPQSLQKLARALSKTPEDLLPNSLESAIDQESPALELKQSRGHPDKLWVRVNRLVTWDQARQLIDALTGENASHRGDASDL